MVSSALSKVIPVIPNEALSTENIAGISFYPLKRNFVASSYPS